VQAVLRRLAQRREARRPRLHAATPHHSLALLVELNELRSRLLVLGVGDPLGDREQP
jgi:hypothetical protein